MMESRIRLFLAFLFIYTQGFTNHARLNCHATKAGVLVRDARIHRPFN
jgi:hypothetical protein